MTGQADPAPAWLLAWRAEQGLPLCAPQPPAQREQATSQQGSTPAATVSTTAEAQRPRPDWQGFVEPRAWPVDDGTRREPVLDTDYMPPRVVRLVGWRSCLRCRQPFFSQDVQRLRLCYQCKETHQ